MAIFSLGKYVYEDKFDKKMWVKEPGMNKYANPFKNYVRQAPEEDLDFSINSFEQGEHLICSKDMSLTFSF